MRIRIHNIDTMPDRLKPYGSQNRCNLFDDKSVTVEHYLDRSPMIMRGTWRRSDHYDFASRRHPGQQKMGDQGFNVCQNM